MGDANYGELIDQLRGHGHHYKSVAELGDFVQRAAREVQNEHTWPWALKTTEITGGLEIADLATVESVMNAQGRTLWPTTLARLREMYGLMESSGESRWWYRRGRVVSVYPEPESDATITVDYFTRYPWVSNAGVPKLTATDNSDVLLCPEENRSLVLLLARVKAKSESQDHDEAAAIRQEYEAELEQMRSKFEQVDEMETVKVTAEEWA